MELYREELNKSKQKKNEVKSKKRETILLRVQFNESVI